MTQQTNRPLVSVVIPVYNRAHTISRSIRSVLAQSYGKLEILVVDDGSSDALDQALSPFRDHINVVRHNCNCGASAARNTGIAAAQGDVVAFCDSDDSWKPEKLEKQLAFMSRNGFDLTCTGYETVHAGTGWLTVAHLPYREELKLKDFVWGCFISPGSTLVAKKAALTEIGGYDPSFPRYEDWNLFLRLTREGQRRVGFLRESLATIFLGGPPSSESCESGLARMEMLHLSSLRSMKPKLARQFSAAVAFERAGVRYRHRDYSGMTGHLLRSWSYAPLAHRSFRIVLNSKIRRGAAAVARSNHYS